MCGTDAYTIKSAKSKASVPNDFTADDMYFYIGGNPEGSGTAKWKSVEVKERTFCVHDTRHAANRRF